MAPGWSPALQFRGSGSQCAPKMAWKVRYLVVRTLNAVTALPSRRGFDCLDGAQRDRVARDGFGGDILFDGQPCVCHGCVLVKGKVWRRLKGFQADKGIDIT